MDEIRWHSATILFTITSSGITNNCKAIGSMSNKVKDVRYKYDLQQAEMMSRKPVESSSNSSQISLSNVDLGMQGLEEGERLARKGHYEESLKVYEQSIELLLHCMKSMESKQKDVIGNSVKVALTDAEAVKANIVKPSAKLANNSSITPTWKNISKKISAAVANYNDVKPLSVSVSPRNSVPNNKPAVSSPQGKRRATLDYTNDPLVQQVKQDLFVDSSELENITWDDIAGLSRAKQSLKESAILPLLRPDLFSGLRKPQNIILYGPPGTGKTLLVKAVARESECLLFSCSASTLTSKWHGESEKLIRTLFKLAADVAPSLIFIDEMDSLLSCRSDSEHEASRRFKTEFMVQMDGLNGNANAPSSTLLVIGCTNCPWNVDDAILRRFPRRILIPLPDVEARTALLEKLLAKAGKHNLSSRQISQLAQRLEGCSGSDINAIAAEASFGPIRSLSPSKLRNVRKDQLRPISIQDFETAMQNTSRSVSKTLLMRYNDWEQQQKMK
jgi:spastin